MIIHLTITHAIKTHGSALVELLHFRRTDPGSIPGQCTFYTPVSTPEPQYIKTSLFSVFKASVGLLWCILWLVVGYEKPENHPKISEKELEYIRRNRVENHHLTTVICVTNSDFTIMKAARNLVSKHHDPNLFATTTFPCCAGLAFECTVCIFNQ